jgi:Fe-S cluster assembly iron-binding protein IscA
MWDTRDGNPPQSRNYALFGGNMVTVTQDATRAIHDLIDATAAPLGAGLRIAADGGGLKLALTAKPQPGDTVVEADGAVLFLDPMAAAELDGRTLSATAEPNGAVKFTVSAQPPAEDLGV